VSILARSSAWGRPAPPRAEAGGGKALHYIDLITLCAPAGIERFFREAGWDLSKPKPRDWEITPAILAAAAELEGQRIIGPPLAAHERAIPAEVLARAVE
jgi:hypothetical protein